MSYLLDTNVLSEFRRKAPNGNVMAWFQKRPPNTLFVSVLTLGEIRKGVENIQEEMRRLDLLDWLDTKLPAYFTGRILPVTWAIADRWGRMSASAGRPIPVIDSLLAATAIHHNLSLVTRNTRDFTSWSSLSVINPWEA